MNNVEKNTPPIFQSTMSSELRKIADLLDKGVKLDVALFVGQGGKCGFRATDFAEPWGMFTSMLDAALQVRESVRSDNRIQILA